MKSQLGRSAAALALVTSLGGAPTALAQDATGRVAVEAVASASITSANTQPFLIFDAVSTIRIAPGWDGIVRPWARRMPAGDWAAEMYQMEVRYTSSTRIPFRVNAGIISSPIGLSTLELRADRNPTIGAPFYYFVPLPAMDGRYDGKRLITGGYPLGAMVSTSGSKWDARAGAMDSSATHAAKVFSSDRRRAAQAVAGGGFTPRQGLRFGAAVAHGAYRAPVKTAAGAMTPAPQATTMTLEGEYAIGFTRVQGEWIRDRFTTAMTPTVARGFNLMATRTLTPRWFTAARLVRASTPVLTGNAPGRRTASSTESTLGYRLTRTFTVRGGYQGSSSLYAPGWTNAAAVSIVWAQTWW